MPKTRRRVASAAPPPVEPNAPPQQGPQPAVTLLSPAAATPPSVQGETLVPPGCRPDAFDHMCERIAMGDPLDTICMDAGMPPKAWIVRKMAKDSALRTRYMEAFDLSVMLEADRLIEIADTKDIDEDPARSSLRVKVRQWLLERRHPKQFSSKVELDHNITGDLLALFEKASNHGHLPPGVE